MEGVRGVERESTWGTESSYWLDDDCDGDSDRAGQEERWRKLRRRNKTRP